MRLTLITLINFDEWGVTLRQGIYRTDDEFPQRAFYKFLVKFGKTFFKAKYIYFYYNISLMF